MKERSVTGTDSSLWRYVNEKMTLDIAYGLYPDDLSSYSNQPEYQKTSYEINGLKAEMCTFRVGQELSTHFTGRNKYIAAVYFPDLKKAFGTKLSILATCEGPGEQEIAKRIFSSLKVN